MRKYLFCFTILKASILVGQGDSVNTSFATYSDSLQTLFTAVYKANNDEEMLANNKVVVSYFRYVLDQKGSYEYAFRNIKDAGIKESPDGRFKLITWNIPLKDGTHKYFGFVHSKENIKKKSGVFQKNKAFRYRVFPLNDVSANVTNAPHYVGVPTKWYGMLYYDIIVKKSKSKVYYTLLAWDGNNKYSTKKILDVLVFDSRGLPRFGANIFTMPRSGSKRRVIFEFDANCAMSLKFDSKKDSIVFDHLSPREEQLVGQYQYDCTDFTYDGFGFSKGKWRYGKFLNVRNQKNARDKWYRSPNSDKDFIRSDQITH